MIIAIIYYLHDIPKYRRMQTKMNLCAHCMVNILQNVSNGQKVTLQHINHAMQAAYLTFYPGKTMLGTAEYYMPLGHFPHGFVYCVKGISGKKASVFWCVAFYIDTTYGRASLCMGQLSKSVIKYLTDVEPSQIYDKLEIKEGEVKILLDCFVVYPLFSRHFSDGRLCRDVSPREAFGFLLLSPKMTLSETFFHNIVTFTPNPGLFNETAPDA